MSNLIFCPSSCLLDPAIRRTLRFTRYNNSLRLIAGCGNDWSISACEFLLEVHVLMSNLIFSLSSSLLDPAIRICTLYLHDSNALRLIAGCGNDCSISTCEFLLEVHVLMSNLIFSLSISLLDPAIRLCTLYLHDSNALRLIAWCGNDWSISTCEFLLEVHVVMSNLIFSPYSCLLDPAIRLCTLKITR